LLIINKGVNPVKIYATASAATKGSANIDGGAFVSLAGGGTVTELVHLFDRQWYTVFPVELSVVVEEEEVKAKRASVCKASVGGLVRG
jgi:hypothetical protein